MSETHTTATVRVAIEIDCSGGGWGGGCKMEQVHKQAQDSLRGILAKAFPINGPVIGSRYTGSSFHQHKDGSHPMTTDYESGFRDGLEKAAKVADDVAVSYKKGAACHPSGSEARNSCEVRAYAVQMVGRAIRALKAPADDGAVRVPREPTREMVSAGAKAFGNVDDDPDLRYEISVIYRAMIAQGEK